MREINYDREAAVAYARKWALSRNDKYLDFDEIGGDCTNFVSQCIFAGSGVMNFTPVYGWYYRTANDRTASWTGVEYLYNFLISNSAEGPYGMVAGRNEVLPGDIVQLGDFQGDFYHTMIITSLFPTILVASHSRDALDRTLWSYDFDVIRYIRIDGVRRQSN